MQGQVGRPKGKWGEDIEKTCLANQSTQAVKRGIRNLLANSKQKRPRETTIISAKIAKVRLKGKFITRNSNNKQPVFSPQKTKER